MSGFSPAPKGARGFVAVEWVAGVALILIPATVLVALLPTWVERRHVATVVAREVAAVAAEDFPASTADLDEVADVIAGNHGVAPDEIDVTVHDDARRGGQLRVRVTVRMPALEVPLVGRAGAWSYTAEHVVRIDDYRSRT